MDKEICMSENERYHYRCNAYIIMKIYAYMRQKKYLSKSFMMEDSNKYYRIYEVFCISQSKWNRIISSRDVNSFFDQEEVMFINNSIKLSQDYFSTKARSLINIKRSDGTRVRINDMINIFNERYGMKWNYIFYNEEDEYEDEDGDLPYLDAESFQEILENNIDRIVKNDDYKRTGALGKIIYYFYQREALDETNYAVLKINNVIQEMEEINFEGLYSLIGEELLEKYCNTINKQCELLEAIKIIQKYKK